MWIGPFLSILSVYAADPWPLSRITINKPQRHVFHLQLAGIYLHHNSLSISWSIHGSTYFSAAFMGQLTFPCFLKQKQQNSLSDNNSKLNYCFWEFLRVFERFYPCIVDVHNKHIYRLALFCCKKSPENQNNIFGEYAFYRYL